MAIFALSPTAPFTATPEEYICTATPTGIATVLAPPVIGAKIAPLLPVT